MCSSGIKKIRHYSSEKGYKGTKGTGTQYGFVQGLRGRGRSGGGAEQPHRAVIADTTTPLFEDVKG